ncbi:sulfate ABC transporter permease subunit CysT [Caulobacter sp. S45]|uniref:sulfate ABC transporter permease subunit CysT n=1 Tax=Caulobacter sp. S45 TaxID=1641861 RepID=UPI00131AC03F|nr:sulfate ABC transporter permease subunit CysT [Caulobacter sp. S45]
MSMVASKRPLLVGTGKLFRRRSAIPGLGVTLGVTLTALCLIVLIPLASVFAAATQLGLGGFVRAAFSARALHAYALSFTASLIGAAVNSVFGLLTAWALVRYDFPGRAILNALVDLPFALPTAVAGIALAGIYSTNGWIGAVLAPLGIKAAYNEVGVVIALTFVGLPFVVRTVEPVLRDLAADVEEAAASLGAGRWRTIARVILPALAPAWITGFTLAFARAVGEYGSVIFIAGNMPYRTEIAPLLITIELEQFDYGAASAIAAVMLVVAFLMLLAINAVQAWSRRSV